jgi:hypothetical protein
MSRAACRDAKPSILEQLVVVATSPRWSLIRDVLHWVDAQRYK